MAKLDPLSVLSMIVSVSSNAIPAYGAAWSHDRITPMAQSRYAGLARSTTSAVSCTPRMTVVRCRMVPSGLCTNQLGSGAVPQLKFWNQYNALKYGNTLIEG